MNNYKLLFKLTSRSRPEKFFNTIRNIIQQVSIDCMYRIHCTLDSCDSSMNNPYVISQLDKIANLFYIFGDSKNKIDAINRDMESVGDWDILINMSDDVQFTASGFDVLIKNSFGDNLNQCVHFPDQNQGEKCMTVSMMGREYYNNDGFIYNPSFESLWCDVVAQEVAQVRKQYKYVPANIFNHLHPSFGHGQYDEQYRKTEAADVRIRDYKTYLKLKSVYDPTNIYPIRPL